MKLQFLSLSVLFLSVLFLGQANGQNLPGEKLIKLGCWKLVMLDSAFTETTYRDSTIYLYYEYRDSVGNYVPAYNKKGFLPKHFSKATFTKANFRRMKRPWTPDSKLLYGTVDYYDSKDQLFRKYVLENGFIRKIYKYNFRLFGSKFRATKNGDMTVSWEFPRGEYYRMGGCCRIKI